MTSILSSIQFLMRGGVMMYPLVLSGFISLVIIIERLWLLQFKLTQKEYSPAISVIQAAQGARTPAQQELAMKSEAETWVPLLEKRMDVLDTIITAAPLMGLLGTITGMMSSFQVLSDKGGSDPAAITGGVAESLISTATGLVVALVTLIAFNYFNRRIQNIILEMEHAASKFLQNGKVP